MNKLLFLLSMLLVLTGCTTTIPDENTLSPGIMEPVSGTGAVAGGSWLPEIKKH
ncbi:lipoprotein [Bisgaard Taxon 45]|uniref:Type IV secretion system putative lipoprotein virB7 n=1 Tax=Bisgaard Taxon 45 TaxID=304289 RepID=A0ABT9KDD6_9PAST|nr:lipoprotein [Bisgaard Taxon 45]